MTTTHPDQDAMRFPETAQTPRVDRLNLTADQKTKLAQALAQDNIKQMRDGITYIDAPTIIDHMNDIFGYGEWYIIHDTQYVEYDGVRLFVTHSRLYIYEVFVAQEHGTEAVLWPTKGRDTPYQRGRAVGTALKKAETNALKRCARLLGKQFGSDVSDEEPYANAGADDSAAGAGGDYYGADAGDGAEADAFVYGQTETGYSDHAAAAAPPQPERASDPHWNRFCAWVSKQGKAMSDVASALGIESVSKPEVVGWAKRQSTGYGGVIEYLTAQWKGDGMPNPNGQPQPQQNAGAAPDAPADAPGGYSDWDAFTAETDAFFAWMESQRVQPVQIAKVLEFEDGNVGFSKKLFEYCQSHNIRLADAQARLEVEMGLTLGAPAPETAPAAP